MTQLHLAARRYLGVPFHHKGRNPAKWLDCVGLAVVAARDCGWSVEDLAAYGKRPKDGVLDRMLEINCGPPVAREPIKESDMQPGDLIALHFDSARVKRGIPSEWPVRHVGIVGDHKFGVSIIHTAMDIGRVVECRIDDEILARIAAVYRRAV